jgi:hypothetical protein
MAAAAAASWRRAHAVPAVLRWPSHPSAWGQGCATRHPPTWAPFSTLLPLRSEGNQAPHQAAGPVVFVLRLQPHAVFSCEGDQLAHVARVPLYQGLAGTSVSIPTLDGRWAAAEALFEGREGGVGWGLGLGQARQTGQLQSTRQPAQRRGEWGKAYRLLGPSHGARIVAACPAAEAAPPHCHGVVPPPRAATSAPWPQGAARAGGRRGDAGPRDPRLWRGPAAGGRQQGGRRRHRQAAPPGMRTQSCAGRQGRTMLGQPGLSGNETQPPGCACACVHGWSYWLRTRGQALLSCLPEQLFYVGALRCCRATF